MLQTISFNKMKTPQVLLILSLSQMVLSSTVILNEKDAAQGHPALLFSPDGKRVRRQVAEPATEVESHVEPDATESEKQVLAEPEVPADPNCNFGRGDELTFCAWKNLNQAMEKWGKSKGDNYGWLGGPREDQTTTSGNGGYALYESSKLVDNPFTQTIASDTALLISPVLQPTEATGNCIDFWYVLDGLSQAGLRIRLRPPSPFLFGRHGTENITDRELADRLMAANGKDDIVLWENTDNTRGLWHNGQVVYSFNDRHMVMFEGLPIALSDTNRAYPGYVAVDDFNFINAFNCRPFCNFEGGFCSWNQDENDDFDWSLGRGTLNPSTGPPMDRFSFTYGIKGGGYAFIDSSYPRRPMDKARLVSEEFSPTDAPLCMRFWTHMFGNGIGALRMIIAPTRGEEEIIWELRGEQGNNWYQGQVTITAINDFQIIFEAEVGQNNLGDIAIDEIALRDGACPTSPQSASKFVGDCTFEVDECGWRNIEFRQGLDELDWERRFASQSTPSRDHTLRTPQGSYIALPRTSVQRGERGWLMSPSMKATTNPICMSFWYFMDEPIIEATGPSLGMLKVMMLEQDDQGFQKVSPLWELKNQQGPNWMYGQTSINSDRDFMILFEGLWGDSRGPSKFIALDDITFFNGDCRTTPEKATTSYLDCDFTRDSCFYMNSSFTRNQRWLSSSLTRRPSTLPDHTYGGQSGYIYFDVFSSSSEIPKITLMSRVIEASTDNEPMCFSLWFAPIGNDPQTRLTITREAVDPSANDPGVNNRRDGGNGLMIWRVDANEVYKGRIEWMFGQVQIATDSDYKISIVGEARKGGFAIDDIKVFPGTCRIRPVTQLLDEN